MKNTVAGFMSYTPFYVICVARTLGYLIELLLFCLTAAHAFGVLRMFYFNEPLLKMCHIC